MTAPQERPVASDGLDLEAIERRAEAAQHPSNITDLRASADDVLALLAALRAAEAEVAESVPRSALVRIGSRQVHTGRMTEDGPGEYGGGCSCHEPVYVIDGSGGT